jgi:HK97 family phage portal protein
MSFLDRVRLKAVQWLSGVDPSSQLATLGPRPWETYGAKVFFSDWPAQNCIIPVDTAAIDFTASSLVMAPVNFLAKSLALPPPVVEQREGDEWEPLAEHPMLDLLARPNQFYSGELLLWSFAYSWIVAGNVFWFKSRDSRGQVRELWPLDATAMTPKYPDDGTEFLSYYEYSVKGKPERIAVEDVVHFRNGIDPRETRMGLAPIRACLAEIAADREASIYSAAILKQGGGVPFAVSPKDSPHPKGLDAAKLKEEIVAAMHGPGFQPLVINRPVEFHDFVFNPEQIGVGSAHRLPEERISAVLGIPAVVLGFGAGLDRATYSNFEQARRIAWEQCLVPTLNYMAAELREQLLIEFEPNNKEFWVAYDYEEVPGLREDQTMAYQREVLAWDKGLKKRSEARASLGLMSDEEDEIYKAAPSQPGFGFGGLSRAERKAFGLWDDQEIARYFRDLAPERYDSLIAAEVRK